MKYFVNDAKSLKCKVSINVVVLKENLLFRAIESQELAFFNVSWIAKTFLFKKAFD